MTDTLCILLRIIMLSRVLAVKLVNLRASPTVVKLLNILAGVIGLGLLTYYWIFIWE